MDHFDFYKNVRKPQKENSKESEAEKDKWFYLDKTEKDTNAFLKMFWKFHDFRVFDFHYHANKNMIDVVLQYDTKELYVILRFVNVFDENFVLTEDFEVDWFWKTELYIDNQEHFVWCRDSGYKNEPELPDYVLWLKSQEFHFAVIDKNYITLEIPEDILNQEWEKEDGGREEFHFIPKPVPKEKIL